VAKPPFVPSFLAGVAHFNAREFWEAHEAWEALWLEADSEMHRFLQGLIQLAAAYHHIQRGTFRGAVRLIDAALQKLDVFPLRFCGVDRSDAEAFARRDRERAARAEFIGQDEYPRLLLIDVNESRMPPRDDW
jgi:predicted metal-dependent hydrolase